VVHGADGLDEISTTGYTKVSDCRDGRVNTFYLHPSDAGIGKAAPESLRGGDAAENAEIARRVLGGATGAARDIVLLNAAAALLVAGQVTTMADGLAAASEALDSGRAARVLDDLRRVSNDTAGPEPGSDAGQGSSTPRDQAAQRGGSISPGSRTEHGASAPRGTRSVASS
jgi:anthranilate phosphoribosyltransferase